MKFTNISKFIIKFMGGGKINFPFNYLKEVEINGDNDGGSGETMDFKTYCDAAIKNYLIDSNIPIEDVVMPDIYVQFSLSNEVIEDGDYLKPYLYIAPLYKDTLVINESKKYINGQSGIGYITLGSGNSVEKDTSIPVENYCIIKHKLI